MSNTATSVQAWVDIIEPARPAVASYDNIWLACSAVFIIVLLAVFYVIYMRHKSGNSIRKIHHQLKNKTINEKAALQQAYHIISNKHARRHLSSRKFNAASQQQWQDFIDELTHRSFAGAPCETKTATRLLTEASKWLG